VKRIEWSPSPRRESNPEYHGSFRRRCVYQFRHADPVPPLFISKSSVKKETQMVEALIALVILIIVVGIIAYLMTMLVNMLPIDGRFKQVANILIMLVAVLIILMRALPLLNVGI
jgi:hypothetical protein